MSTLEVFFDYICPFCLRGHEYLRVLLPSYPELKIQWRPCESHPRPELYGPHSDLCIQGMFYAQEQGADLWAYHDIMYKAALKDRINIEDINSLAHAARGLLDPDGFRDALKNDKYRRVQLEANHHAFERSDVWAVPAYRASGHALDSVENIGVSINQLESFMRLASRR